VTDTWDALGPAAVAGILEPFDGPWWICGGVAIDLFLGQQTREHHDIDVAVFRDHWPSVEDALAGWEFRVGTNQVWARKPDGPWLVEFLLEERRGSEWVYRRHPDVTLPLAEFGSVTSDGTPFERPEVVLLYKSKYAEQEQHEADFAAALPKLGIGARCWLAGALELIDSSHPWMSRIL
jgi:hypothetical protein